MTNRKEQLIKITEELVVDSLYRLTLALRETGHSQLGAREMIDLKKNLQYLEENGRNTSEYKDALDNWGVKF